MLQGLQSFLCEHAEVDLICHIPRSQAAISQRRLSVFEVERDDMAENSSGENFVAWLHHQDKHVALRDARLCY